jgi:hypothetical protein
MFINIPCIIFKTSINEMVKWISEEVASWLAITENP